MSRLFISASSRDLLFAQEVAKVLKNVGHDVFIYSENIRVSDTWPTRQADALEKAEHIICLVSQSFLNSRYCMDEMATGYSKDNLMIVKIGICSLPGQYSVRQFLADISQELQRRQVGVAIEKLTRLLFYSLEGRIQVLPIEPSTMIEEKRVVIAFASFEQVSGSQLELPREWLRLFQKKFQRRVGSYDIELIDIERTVFTEAEAHSCLRQVGGKIIIWGSISALNSMVIRCTSTEEFTEILPNEIYLKESNSPDSQNLGLGLVSATTFRDHVSSGKDVEYLICFILGILQFWEKSMEGAIEYLSDALGGISPERAKPLCAEKAYEIRGIAFNELKNYKQAVDDLTSAININSEYGSAYYNRGVLRAQFANYQRAVNDYTEAIRLGANLAEAFFSRGLAHDHLGNYREAIEDFTSAIQEKQNFSNAFFFRGLSYKALKDWCNALHDFVRSENPFAGAEIYQMRKLCK